MDVLEAILLGAVQGLTEFLPVSSSGHLSVLEDALGWDPEASIAFDVVVHVATLLAVVIAYRKSLWAILRDHRRALIPLALGTAPLALAPLFAKSLAIEFKGNPTWLGLAFWGTAALLLIADAPFLRRKPRGAEAGSDGPDEPDAPDGQPAPREPYVPGKQLQALSPGKALLVGLAQLVAVIPGVSRSGSTISTGLLLGVSPLVAAELSFLLSIPAILGATALEAREIGGLASASPGPLVAGFVSSLLTGLAALWLLKRLLKRRAFWVFAPYLLLLGGWCVWRGMSGT